MTSSATRRLASSRGALVGDLNSARGLATPSPAPSPHCCTASKDAMTLGSLPSFYYPYAPPTVAVPNCTHGRSFTRSCPAARNPNCVYGVLLGQSWTEDFGVFCGAPWLCQARGLPALLAPPRPGGVTFRPDPGRGPRCRGAAANRSARRLGVTSRRARCRGDRPARRGRGSSGRAGPAGPPHLLG